MHQQRGFHSLRASEFRKSFKYFSDVRSETLIKRNLLMQILDVRLLRGILLVLLRKPEHWPVSMCRGLAWLVLMTLTIMSSSSDFDFGT
eukprot:UN02806